MRSGNFVNKLFLQAPRGKFIFEEISPMKKLPGLFVSLFIYSFGFSQHYYNDIISTHLSNANYQLLKQANIRSVKGSSYEADDNPSENFSLQQEFSRDRKRLTTTATNTNNITTITTSYFENDRLKRTADSLGTVSNIVDYQYDDQGKITRIATSSADPEHNGTTTEVHQWFYRNDGSPDHMLKIKNGSDTVNIEFICDEKGNVAEERWRWKGRLLNTYYYYYNDKNQLTDVVTYNVKAKKMLPDFIFEYDSNGRISQMMQTIRGTSNYLLWKYTYDEAGLKKKETCYNKNKQLVGRVEYSYSR